MQVEIHDTLFKADYYFENSSTGNSNFMTRASSQTAGGNRMCQSRSQSPTATGLAMNGKVT